MIRAALVALALVPTAFAQAASVPRTPEGHPDFQGVWESRWFTPLERLDGTADAIVSGDAAVAYAAARLAALRNRNPLHPDEDFDFAGLLPAGDGAFRTSLIVEPADGKRPSTALAKRIAETGPRFRDLAENPEALTNDERCLSAAGRAPLGLTAGSMYRQIVQTAGHFLIYTEDQMSTRIIGIDAPPRPAAMISPAGDSVATWEGDTLVVVTTNMAPQLAPPGTPAFNQQRRVTERFSPLGPDRISYDYVLEDSVMLTRPMRVQFDLMRTRSSLYESACHEGNQSLPNMLRGARTAEKRAARGKSGAHR